MNRYKNVLIIALVVCAMLWFLQGNYLRNIVNVNNIVFYLSRDTVKKSAAYLKAGMQFRNVEVFELPDSIDYWMMVDDSIANILLASPNPQNKINNIFQNEGIKRLREQKMAWINRKLVPLQTRSIPFINSVDNELIKHHADSMYRIWKTSRFAGDVDYNLFLEGILPFNNSIAPRLSGSEILAKTFYKTWKHFGGDTMTMAQTIDFFHLYLECLSKQPMAEKIKLPFMGYYSVICLKATTCIEQSELEAQVLRGLGIPAQRVYVNQFADLDLKHYFLRVNTGRDTFCYTALYEPVNIDYKKQRVTPRMFEKVFMESWGVNKHSPALKNEGVNKNCAFIYTMDITRETNGVTDVGISEKELDRQPLYLCSFSPRGFMPQDVALASGYVNKAFVFKDVSRGFTYFLCKNKHGEMVPCGSPFFIDPQGKVIKVIPKGKCDMRLLRKYHEPDFIQQYVQKNIGTQFLVSNTWNCKDSTCIATIDSFQQPYVARIKVNRYVEGKFLKVKAASGNMINVGEVAFLTDMSNKNQLRMPPSFPILSFSDTSSKPEKYRCANFTIKCIATNLLSASQAFDGVPETFFSGRMLLVMFDEPTIIREIRFCPRTPNNTIQIGHDYELLAFDNGWQSIGTKKANYNFLEFEQVPANTIYWLRDLTAGKQENCFYYKEGIQYFVNCAPFPY